MEKETRQGLINYLNVIADNVKMHQKATAAVRQAASIIQGITDDEFVEIELLHEADLSRSAKLETAKAKTMAHMDYESKLGSWDNN